MRAISAYDSARGLPCSRVSDRARSSPARSTASAALRNAVVRAAGSARQPCQARWARSTTASSSSGRWSGASSKASPVAGSMTAKRADRRAGGAVGFRGRHAGGQFPAGTPAACARACRSISARNAATRCGWILPALRSPPSQTAPRTPTMSVPMPVSGARSLCRTLPARAASRPRAWADRTNSAQTSGGTWSNSATRP